MKAVKASLENMTCNEIADFARFEFGIEVHDWNATENASQMARELTERMAAIDIAIVSSKVSSKSTKGEKINQNATITDAWTACQGNMGWESPVIEFTLEDGRKVEWLTDNEMWLYEKGTTVELQCFYYAETNRIRRVKINGTPAAKIRARDLQRA